MRNLGNPEDWRNPGSHKMSVVAGGGSGSAFASGYVNVSDMAGDTTEERFVAALGAAGYVIVDQDVIIDGDIITGVGQALDFMGGSIAIRGSLKIKGPIVAPHTEIFQVELPPVRGAEKLSFFSDDQPGTAPKVNEFMGEVSAAWFDSSSDDWGERVNKALRCGGSDVVVRIPPIYADWGGQQYGMVRTTIDCDQDRWYSHQTIRGSSHIGATLCIDKDLSIVGIDASNSRELMLDCVRMTEASGSRTSCICAGGGTTLRIRSCWFANGKYGYVQNKGAGTDIDGLTAEACLHAVYISGSLFDDTIANFPAYSSVRRVTVRGLLVYGCFETGVTVERGNAYGVDGVAFVGMTVHYQDYTPLRFIDTYDGTAIISCTSCYLRDVPVSEVNGPTVQWVASMVIDADSPDGRETLLP